MKEDALYMPFIVTIANRGRIPFLNKVGPIGTPIELSDELYHKLCYSGVKMNIEEITPVIKTENVTSPIIDTVSEETSMESEIVKELNENISEPPANMSNRQKKKWKAEQRRIAAATIVEKVDSTEISEETTESSTPSNVEETNTEDVEEVIEENKEIVSE